MTGYGKAECVIAGDKYLFEIRSVNGKNADLSIKTSLIPREKEAEVRKYVVSVLNRGNIDLFANVERAGNSLARTINKSAAGNYISQIKELAAENGLAIDDSAILSSVMRMPDVMDCGKTQELTEEEWEQMFSAVRSAVEALDEFRTREGESLRRDVLGQISKIEAYVCEIEKYEKERIETVRGRLKEKLAELEADPDPDRLEQEMIYYIEKLDINEEKVRLRQHCKYFRETVDNEEFPGRKLGFIAQEMGREINTTGSKANHAEIQKTVVKMKDELEKIKEQSLNVL